MQSQFGKRGNEVTKVVKLAQRTEYQVPRGRALWAEDTASSEVLKLEGK